MLKKRIAQVNSEFQAFKHIKITAPGEMARATKSLEATLALQPTLILTNSLPCSLDVIVWQARLQLCLPSNLHVIELVTPGDCLECSYPWLCIELAAF